MNTREIRYALRNTRYFDDVYSVDTLPSHPRDVTLVCNLDPSDQPGTHWVAIYVDSSGTHAEYFDSYGKNRAM